MKVPNKNNEIPADFPNTIEDFKNLTPQQVDVLLNHYGLKTDPQASVFSKKHALGFHIGIAAPHISNS